MTQIKISQLTTGTPLATDETPATDVQDTTQAASGTTKKYLRVDELYFDLNAQGVTTIASVVAATTTVLTATYSNGTAGVGATLTNAGSLGALTIDGVTLAASDRVLIKNQVADLQNGIYTVTTVGNGSTNWVLTRATDYNESGDIEQYAVVMSNEGTANAGILWQETAATPIVIGTDAITFSAYVASSSAMSGIVDTGTQNELAYYAANGNTVSGLTTANTGLLRTSATGVPSIGNSLEASFGFGDSTASQQSLTIDGSNAGVSPITSADFSSTLYLRNNSVIDNNFTNIVHATPTGARATASIAFVNDSHASAQGSMKFLTRNSIGGGLVNAMTISNAQVVSLANPLAVSSGGTGLASLSTYRLLAAGTTSTGALQQVSAGTSGQLLQSGGASALPSWTTATFPATAGTTGTILRSDGTNWVASTSTFANSYSVSTLLYASSANTVTGLATANNGLLVTDGSGVPSIGNAIGADLTVNTVRVGLGGGSVASNIVLGIGSLPNGATSGTEAIAIGRAAMTAAYSGVGTIAIGTSTGSSVASGDQNTLVGYITANELTTGDYNTCIGSRAGSDFASGSTELTTGSRNTLLGYNACVDTNSTTGAIAIGSDAVTSIASGATSSDNGPGIAIGSSGFPVGFRGDGTIYPSTTGAGFWRMKVNGTNYMLPLITDGASAWPAITTTSLTAGNINIASNTVSSTDTNGYLNFIPNGTGQVHFGSTTSVTGIGAGFFDVTIAKNSSRTFLNICKNSSSASSGVAAFYTSRNTTVGSFTTVNNGDSLSEIQTNADDGTSFVTCGLIDVVCTAAPSTGIIPTAMRFYTQNTSGSNVLALDISNAQVATFSGQVIAPSFSPNTTSGIIGTTTNDNAASGSVGQTISSVIAAASAVSLTTATPANVTSISLTAGDWDVWANVTFIPAATTNVVQARGWISSTSASLPDASLYSGVQNAAAGIVPADNFGFEAPSQRFSLSGTTTIYLSVTSAFSVDTLAVCGGIYARRRR